MGLMPMNQLVVGGNGGGAGEGGAGGEGGGV
jgi:hypothetical protein